MNDRSSGDDEGNACDLGVMGAIRGDEYLIVGLSRRANSELGRVKRCISGEDGVVLNVVEHHDEDVNTVP